MEIGTAVTERQRPQEESSFQQTRNIHYRESEDAESEKKSVDLSHKSLSVRKVFSVPEV